MTDAMNRAILSLRGGVAKVAQISVLGVVSLSSRLLV